jgi:hypothetical protein
MSSESLEDILRQPAPTAIPGFMERWHGVTSGEPLALPRDARLPAVLKGFYESFGTAAETFLINRLLSPAEMEQENGFCVFYVEEQGVYLWGIAVDDLDADDPPIWCRENEPGKWWVKDAPSTSVFLLQMLVMSAALNGPHAATAAWLSPEEVLRVLSPLATLDLPPWHWPAHPARWYAGDDVVAFTCPNVAPGNEANPDLSVWVGALTEQALYFIEPHLSNAWDYYSPRDG